MVDLSIERPAGADLNLIYLGDTSAPHRQSRLPGQAGLNAFVRDRYSEPSYAQGFDDPQIDRPDLVSAFKVLKHSVEPKRDVARS